jgi:hypothetical protein
MPGLLKAVLDRWGWPGALICIGSVSAGEQRITLSAPVLCPPNRTEKPQNARKTPLHTKTPDSVELSLFYEYKSCTKVGVNSTNFASFEACPLPVEFLIPSRNLLVEKSLRVDSCGTTGTGHIFFTVPASIHFLESKTAPAGTKRYSFRIQGPGPNNPGLNWTHRAERRFETFRS